MNNSAVKAPTSPAWLSAVEVVRAVRGGELGSQDVVEAHLERIARLDGRVHAYVHVDRGARAGRGPLAGVTLAVKDSQPVAGMPWTWGSARYRDRIARQDAIPVARARAAGAALLGKVNTPELAASVGTTNQIFPATENPWRPGYTPGGSSGGSGAAVAAGLCTVAFGEDSGGSIRIPASNCGVVGLRPRTGLVPQETPDPSNLSSRGPLARTVADARLLLEVMLGERAPRPRPAAPLRIAVATESPFGVDAACGAAAERAAAALQQAGHSTDRIPWDPEPVAEAYRVVRRASVAGEPGEPGEYGPAVGALIADGRRLSAADFFAAHRKATAAAWRLNTLLREGFDAILTPTLGLLPMPIAEVPAFLGEGWDSYTQFVLPVSFSGLAAISVPAGTAAGLPVGVQLVARDEWRLLPLAEELEGAEGFGFQPPPGFD